MPIRIPRSPHAHANATHATHLKARKQRLIDPEADKCWQKAQIRYAK
jgi:hypothetical protein